MTSPYANRRWIEITPAGIRYPRRSIDSALERFWRQISQVRYLSRRSIVDKTHGKTLGKLWILLDPILQAIVYFVILAVIFQISGTDVTFMSIYLSINVWRLNGSIFGIAPTLITGHASILQQTNFPLEILIVEQILTQLFLFVLNMSIVFALLFLGGIYPKTAWLLLPAVLAAHVAFSMAVAVVFALIGALVRDFTQIATVLVQLWFYGSPVVYGMERIPQPARFVMEWINPFVTILPAYRQILIEGRVPDALGSVLLVLVGSLLALFLMSRYLDQARHRLYQYL